MADILLTRQSVLFVKTETTYGTDSIGGSVTAGDAVLSTIPDFSFDVETYERNLARESLSPLDPRVTNINCSLSFSCELRGSGTATTPPEINALLKACGFSVATESAAVFYNPVTTASSSCTIYFYQGDPGQLKKLTGCVGNVSFAVEQGGIGVANFEMQGKFDGTAAFVSNTAIPTADYDEELPPIAQNISFVYGNDSTFEISSVEVNMNNEIQNVKTMNSSAKTATNFFLTGRSPGGSFNPLIETSAVENVITNLEGSTGKNLQFLLGSTGGNKITFYLGGSQSGGTVTDRDAVTLTNLGFEDSDGLARYNCEYQLGAGFDTGNDEILIKFW